MSNEPPEDEHVAASLMLDIREATIVRALIRDGTSATAARTLGLSERHTRRLLRALEARLGVTNTHALVATAVSARLVDPPSPTASQPP